MSEKCFVLLHDMELRYISKEASKLRKNVALLLSPKMGDWVLIQHRYGVLRWSG